MGSKKGELSALYALFFNRPLYNEAYATPSVVQFQTIKQKLCSFSLREGGWGASYCAEAFSELARNQDDWTQYCKAFPAGGGLLQWKVENFFTPPAPKGLSFPPDQRACYPYEQRDEREL